MSSAMNAVMRAQAGHEDAELVGCSLAHRRQPPAVHERRCHGTRRARCWCCRRRWLAARESPHIHRSSPAMMRSMRSPVCTSSAPRSSIARGYTGRPAVVPFDARAHRRRRRRAPCPQNIIGIAARSCCCQSGIATSTCSSNRSRSIAVPSSDSSDVARVGHIGRIGRAPEVDARRQGRSPGRASRSRCLRRECPPACAGRPSHRSATSARSRGPRRSRWPRAPRRQPRASPARADCGSASGLVRRAKDKGEIQPRARRRAPRAPATAAPGRLLVGHDDHALGGTGAGRRGTSMVDMTWNHDLEARAASDRDVDRRESARRRVELEAEVGGTYRVRERADRHELRAGGRDFRQSARASRHRRPRPTRGRACGRRLRADPRA